MTETLRRNKLKDLFYDPSVGLVGFDKFYEKVRNLGYSEDEVRDFLRKQEISQVHRAANVKQRFIPIRAKYPKEQFQADLADFSKLSKWNRGIRYLLVVIDVYSRMLWVRPLKTKAEATKELIAIIARENPENLSSDRGTEFTNNTLRIFLRDKGVKRWLSDPGEKNNTMIVERVIRTIRDYIKKYMTAFSTRRYIDKLDNFILNYNNSVHSGIENIPKLTYEKRLYVKREPVPIINLKVGDKVRILQKPKLFDKKSSLNIWSTEVYPITERVGYAFRLKDMKRGYRPFELLKVDEVERRKSKGLPISEISNPLKETADDRKERRLKRLAKLLG